MTESPPAVNPHRHEHTVIESLQSLIVAFVLAMTFRGFVTEGFVIPTGSMAPTLLGQHRLLESPQTGARFPIGADVRNVRSAPDEMLGPNFTPGIDGEAARLRMGDRILVLKCLYPFIQPRRFDVVVFKNPTDPDGKAANYIKRLIGLPNEKVWLVDGDVFAAPNPGSGGMDEYRIQRKPAHVQQAVWQPVHHSDYIPLMPDRLAPPYTGPPWRGEGWDTSGRSYSTQTAEPTTLIWDSTVRSLNDWTSYDVRNQNRPYPVADLRVRAGITAQDPSALETIFQIDVRNHLFQFVIRGAADGDAVAEVRLRPLDSADAWQSSGPQSITLPGKGRVFDVEFWHVDQAMSIFLDGKRVAHLEYDWSGGDRLAFVSGVDDLQNLDKVLNHIPPPRLEWRHRGSPLTMKRVAVDRDLYYQAGMLKHRDRANPPFPGHEEAVRPGTAGAATHPDKPAVLGPDHFFMLGDNSQASLDSRLWGSPHPLVAAQVDPHPFVVHRSLLIGKAWVVYFPAPYHVSKTGYPIVPDFGRLRFIR